MLNHFEILIFYIISHVKKVNEGSAKYKLSKSDTIPTNVVNNQSSFLEHEATVSKISEDKLFYLMSKGIPEETAKELIILGFVNEFREELPMEYAVELNRLLQINMESN